MNPYVSYNPNVGQTNQSALAYTTSGMEQQYVPKNLGNGSLENLSVSQKKELGLVLGMLENDIIDLMAYRQEQVDPNVRH